MKKHIYFLAVAVLVLGMQVALRADSSYTFNNKTGRDIILPVIYLPYALCPNRTNVAIEKDASYKFKTACTGIDSVSFGYTTGDHRVYLTNIQNMRGVPFPDNDTFDIADCKDGTFQLVPQGKACAKAALK